MDLYKKLESIKVAKATICSLILVLWFKFQTLRSVGVRVQTKLMKKMKKKHIQNEYKIGAKEERRRRRISYQCFDFNLIYIFVFP